MGPRRGASKDVMGDAGGDSSQGRPCPRAESAVMAAILQIKRRRVQEVIRLAETAQPVRAS